MNTSVILKVGESSSVCSKDLFINGTKKDREDIFYTLLKWDIYDNITFLLREKDIKDLSKMIVNHLKNQSILELYIEPEICKLNEDGSKKECL